MRPIPPARSINSGKLSSERGRGKKSLARKMKEGREGGRSGRRNSTLRSKRASEANEERGKEKLDLLGMLQLLSTGQPAIVGFLSLAPSRRAADRPAL